MLPDLTKAYGRIQKSAISGRAAEAEAFAKSARRLHQAALEPIDAVAFEDALQTNQKLWTLVQASLLEEEGRFPEDLRKDILELSLYVDKQTMKASAAPSLGNVELLIDINRNMAGGLFENPAD